MHEETTETAFSSTKSSALAEAPRSRRGGRRPGAGRPRKLRDPAQAAKVASRVDVGDVVWVWIRPYADEPAVSPRPALVVAREPGSVASRHALTVRVFYQDGTDESLVAPFSTTPAEKHWTIPPSRGGPLRPI